MVNGFHALRPADEKDALQPEDVETVLIKGEGYGQKMKPGEEKNSWPTYRSNNLRSGWNNADHGSNMGISWEYAFNEVLSAPVCAQGRVFISLPGSHRVVCLSSETGELLWQFIADGRIDSPPSHEGGFLVFGSMDGSVYALDADNGNLVWRFKAIEKDQFITVDNRLESQLPVHGSLLIEDGVVYFAAGRNAFLDLGIYIYGLDLESGAVRYSRHYKMEEDNSETILEETIHVVDGVKNDILLSDGDSIYIHTNRFDKTLANRVQDHGRTSVHGKMNIRGFHGLLYGDYSKRTSWHLPLTMDRGQLISFDDQHSYVATMFEELIFLKAEVGHFSPGKGGYIYYARSLDSKEKIWERKIPLVPRAMAATKKYLVIAGSPDMIDGDDPLLNYEYRGNGRLLLLSKETGKQETGFKIASVPVFNGIAVTDENLVLCMENGSVICMNSR